MCLQAAQCYTLWDLPGFNTFCNTVNVLCVHLKKRKGGWCHFKSPIFVLSKTFVRNIYKQKLQFLFSNSSYSKQKQYVRAAFLLQGSIQANWTSNVIASRTELSPAMVSAFCFFAASAGGQAICCIKFCPSAFPYARKAQSYNRQ